MLAYSVFSLRLSDDVPSQSDSVHLISLYLTVCMFFSLSAMTWFAITNKLREKKRLPHWLRWFALNYLSYLVCANSMHRKAQRAVKAAETLRQSSSTLPIHSPIESENSPNPTPVKVPLLMNSKSSITIPVTTNESLLSPNRSPSTVWVRRGTRKSSASFNGPEISASSASSRKPNSNNGPSTTKSQESLYAIHIINRLVFLVFLIFVIVFNIYIWFLYSRSIQTKLFDNATNWTCFDEKSLSIVQCNQTF